MTALCERYGISRKTGYKWLGRYRADGSAGLVDRAAGAASAGAWPARMHGRGDRRPCACAIRTGGRRSCEASAERAAAGEAWPAASTIGDLLRARGAEPAAPAAARRLPAAPAVPGGDGAERASGASTSRAGSAPATGSAAIR